MFYFPLLPLLSQNPTGGKCAARHVQNARFCFGADFLFSFPDLFGQQLTAFFGDGALS